MTLETQFVDIGRQRLRVAVKRGKPGRTPVVVFNGIGANLELLEPIANALDADVILFDVPGAGGSPLPRRPYRFSSLARLTAAMLDKLGYRGQVDALGVSWGGALAQEFAHTCKRRCRRLILAATSTGALMVPGRWWTIFTLANARRYSDPEFLRRVAPKLYGGRIEDDPALMASFAQHMQAPDARGYLFQQLALVGWTSVRWLPFLRQPTLILAGTRDPLIPVVNAKLMRTLIRRSKLHLVEDGHLFLLTSTSAVVRVVERFLADDDPLVPDQASGKPARRPSNAPGRPVNDGVA